MYTVSSAIAIDVPSVAKVLVDARAIVEFERFEMLPEFTWMTVDGNVNTQPVGVAKVGNVGGRFNVYRDTRTEAAYNLGKANTDTSKTEYALLGYKGPEYYDTGIIYCPYIPVMVQRSIDPNSFYPKVGMLTRYGVVDHLFGASNYYHVVFVLGIGDKFASGSSTKVSTVFQ